MYIFNSTLLQLTTKKAPEYGAFDILKEFNFRDYSPSLSILSTITFLSLLATSQAV